MNEVNWVMHSSNSSKSRSDIDETDDIEVDWDASNQFYFACMIYFDFICTFILLMLSGDIE
jgi:hypothetical protein